MKRALKVVGGLFVVVLLLVAVALGRQWWLKREHDELQRREAVRAPVTRPSLQLPTTASLPVARAACITGLVLKDRSPVANALVSATPAPPDSSDCPCATRRFECGCPAGLQFMLDTLAPGQGLVAGTESTTTDAEGHFALCGGAVRSRMVWAETTDGFMGGGGQKVLGAEGEAPLVIELVPPAVVTGRVVDESNAPVPHAAVLALQQPAVTSTRTEAGDDGRFSLKTPAALFSSRLVVGAPGFAPVSVVANVDVPLTVVLTRPANVFVRVQQLGSPVPGAVVSLENAQLPSGPDGVAAFTNVGRTPSIEVEAHKGSLVGEARLAVTAEATHAFIELEEGAIVKGVVTRTDGKPVEGARVVVDGRVNSKTTVGADGRFEVPSVFAGQVSVRVFADGCVSSLVREEFVPPGVTELELSLPCEATLDGQVVDAKGAGVRDLSVNLSCDGKYFNTSTDSLGAFHLGPPPGACTLTTDKTQFRAVTLHVNVPTHDVRVVLDAAASISGTVRGPEGNGVAGAEVVVVPALLAELFESKDNNNGTTDKDGHFTVSALKPGRFTVAAMHGSGTGRSVEVLVEPGAAVEHVEVPLTGQALITGAVRDAQGRPIAGAFLRLSPADEKDELTRAVGALARGDLTPLLAAMSTTTRSDLEGRFTLRPSSETNYTLEASAPHFKEAKLPARPGAIFNVVLDPAERRLVKGRVLDAQGPLTAFVVGGDAISSPDGRFEVDVAVSAETLTFSAPGHARQSRPMTPKDTDVGDITLGVGVVVTVTARDDEGKALKGVQATLKQGGVRVGGATGPAGVVALKGLATGPAQLTGTFEGYLEAKQDVAVAEPQTSVELVLRRAHGGIWGVVRGPQGPLADQTVELAPGWRHVMTGVDGAFEMASVLPGTYSVIVRRERSGQGVRVDVADARVPVNFDFSGAVLEGEARLGGDLLVGGLVVAVQADGVTFAGEELIEPGLEVLQKVPRAAWATVREGRFALEGLPAGHWSLFLVALSDLAEKALEPVTSVDVSASERRRVDLKR
jgi:protocatechuate 3,4-dioxygenase beta subunit